MPLGENQMVRVYDSYGKIYVANMIAQHSYISDDNPIPLKYKALVNCMADVATYCL